MNDAADAAAGRGVIGADSAPLKSGCRAAHYRVRMARRGGLGAGLRGIGTIAAVMATAKPGPPKNPWISRLLRLAAWTGVATVLLIVIAVAGGGLVVGVVAIVSFGACFCSLWTAFVIAL